MKLWKDNKVDAEWELPDDEVASRFLASKYANPEEYPWPLERRLRVFISDNEPDGLQSVFDWEDPSYSSVLDIIEARPAAG